MATGSWIKSYDGMSTNTFATVKEVKITREFMDAHKRLVWSEEGSCYKASAERETNATDLEEGCGEISVIKYLARQSA